MSFNDRLGRIEAITVRCWPQMMVKQLAAVRETNGLSVGELQEGGGTDIVATSPTKLAAELVVKVVRTTVGLDAPEEPVGQISKKVNPFGNSGTACGLKTPIGERTSKHVLQ